MIIIITTQAAVPTICTTIEVGQIQVIEIGLRSRRHIRVLDEILVHILICEII
jgi:hypothetical protein